MSLVIELPKALERKIVADAQKRGVSVSEVVAERWRDDTEAASSKTLFDKEASHGKPPLVPREPGSTPLLRLLDEWDERDKKRMETATPEMIAEAQADVDDFLANVRENRLNIPERFTAEDE